MKQTRLVAAVLFAVLIVASCVDPTTSVAETQVLTYNGNNEQAGGTAPSAATVYTRGLSVVVLNNIGDYSKAGYNFAGWNDREDGTGLTFAPGASLTIANQDITLYAVWIPHGMSFISNKNSITINSSNSSALGGVVVIPNGVTHIAKAAFKDCTEVTEFIIAPTVVYLGEEAFLSCLALEKINIPSGVQTISNSLFINCFELSTLSLPLTITSIGSFAFQNCKKLLSPGTLPGLKEIKNNAFQYCELLSTIELPEGLSAIGSSAFSSCFALSTVSVPASVTSIGFAAFASCTNLISVTMLGSTPPALDVDSNCFASTHASLQIHVPTPAALTAFQAATGWQVYSANIVTP